MLTSSDRFWDKFGSWITCFYNEMVKRSGAPGPEVWLLVSHCVRVIFSELRGARLPGTHETEDGMFWAALQCSRVQTELVACKFQGHPRVAVILHEHLLDHSTPLSLFRTLESKLALVAKDAKDAKIVADRALSVAGSKKKAPP
jgi:hypothetical protein